MRLASNNVKKISLELGGKSAERRLRRRRHRALRGRVAVLASSTTAARTAAPASRILVERSVHEQVVELFAEATRKVDVGDPADDKTEVGTLVSFKQRDRVRDYIEIGLGEGANLVVGGDGAG